MIRYQRLAPGIGTGRFAVRLQPAVLLLLLAIWYGYTLLLEKRDLAVEDDPLKNLLLFLAPAFVLAGALPFSALVPIANLGRHLAHKFSQLRGMRPAKLL